VLEHPESGYTDWPEMEAVFTLWLPKANLQLLSKLRDHLVWGL
jgi:hypothetical protein